VLRGNTIEPSPCVPAVNTQKKHEIQHQGLKNIKITPEILPPIRIIQPKAKNSRKQETTESKKQSKARNNRKQETVESKKQPKARNSRKQKTVESKKRSCDRSDT